MVTRDRIGRRTNAEGDTVEACTISAIQRSCFGQPSATNRIMTPAARMAST